MVLNIGGHNAIDVCENVKFLYNDSKEEIKETISEIMQDDVYDKMKKNAINASKQFRYSDIAKRSIET